MKSIYTNLLTASAALVLATHLSAQDMPLSQVLLPGEDWEIVVEGYGFTDAPASDAEGNFYFTDVKEGEGIYQISPDGEISLWAGDLPGVSGMQFGPDGRIYCCQGRLERVIAVSEGGEVEVLLEGVRPNDLVVTAAGGVYFTHTKPQKVEYIAPDGTHQTVHEGDIVRPNGITLSPDQSTLIVSDHGGENVWAFRIEEDGTLSNAQSYMTVRTPEDSEVSKGDGSTTDAYGRYYITTDAGLHMFDPTGRLGGVIAKPEERLTSVEFGGPEMSYLYVAAGEKIYRRKTASRGLHFWQEPVKTLPWKP